MKKGIHPENYRPVVFKDMSNDEIFITRSTIAAKDTIEVDGETYPLVKLEITSSSHPFFTGKQKLVDTAGRVDKFMSLWFCPFSFCMASLCRITVCVPICICQVVWPSCYRRVFLHRQPCLIRISILVIVSEHN